ncbi:gelsolin repeat protein [Ancylostoma ceylanicum]|uniref:Gelsolin repeat protein n=1 Tax=Ancylostoma ceylanicum TaxID=53326 RepID=A0A0D6L5C8_9BILA|nr:gelsolin repeat protein [Ancylostoma ceylanicum]
MLVRNTYDNFALYKGELCNEKGAVKITTKFKLEPVAKEEYGEFYTGDAYICLNTKSTSEWNVHFWLGEDATTDEMGTAAIKTVEMDQALAGLPVQYREIQCHESSLFLSYFPDGIRYLSGGYDSGYHHVEDMLKDWKPRLFHCKGKRNVRCAQVECKDKSLNLGDVFILDLGRELYVWMPPESGRLERIKGMACAKNIALVERHGQAQVHILDSDWDQDETFWSHFGGKSAAKKIARARNDDEDYWKRTSEQVTLYKVSDASGSMKATKVAQGEVKQSELDTKDAFILDAVNGGIFVWVGKGCNIDERSNAFLWGENYLKQKKLPKWTQVTSVLEGVEPSSFTQWFGDWEEGKKKKSFEPRLFQVSDNSGKLVVEEIANFNQESLDGDDVMILDALNSIYVWVGAGANPKEKEGAQNTAKKYLQQGALPRHKNTTIETIYQGKETPTFKKFFRSWDDKLFQSVSQTQPQDDRSVESMRKLLFNR